MKLSIKFYMQPLTYHPSFEKNFSKSWT